MRWHIKYYQSLDEQRDFFLCRRIRKSIKTEIVFEFSLEWWVEVRNSDIGKIHLSWQKWLNKGKGTIPEVESSLLLRGCLKWTLRGKVQKVHWRYILVNLKAGWKKKPYMWEVVKFLNRFRRLNLLENCGLFITY